MNSVKIGGVKYKVEDLDPKLRERIEEQLGKEFNGEKIDTNLIDEKDNKNKKKNQISMFRKIFGHKSGIFEGHYINEKKKRRY